MGVIDDKPKNIIKKLRYSWTLVILVFLFIIVLWTFQLLLIIRFQTFWPGIKRLNATEEYLHGTIYMNKFPSRNVLSHKEVNYDLQGHQENNPLLKVVCYLLVNSTEDVLINNFDSTLCTHINVGFAAVINGSLAPNVQSDIKIYQNVINLKTKNPNLKVLLSVQDFSGSNGFKSVIASNSSRFKFSVQAVDLLNKYGFDGLDIDWEFPSWPDDNEGERKNFTLLLETFKQEVKHKNSSLLLSLAVGAPALILLQCYNIKDLANYADYVNLMSYDYHLYSALTPVTGPNSPIFQRPDDSSFFATLNTNWSASHWNFWGMPKEKIIIGIPTYGHSFTLLNEDNNGWNAPAVGFGRLGQNGFISYQDACYLLARPSATHVFDDHYQVPYAYDQSEWISYETVYSVKLKAEFIKKNGYGGSMVFSLNADDTQGTCGSGLYPLTQAISDTLLH